MADRVFMHIGAPLAGSPFLRESLARHRRRLTRLGVFYPPSHLGHQGGHLDAVLDVMSLATAGHAASTGAWDRLAETVRDWRRGTAVLSHELLADADPDQVARIAGSFGKAELHVVYVARDLARQVPLAWQEWVRNGGTATFAEYAERVITRDEHRMSRVFWASHDAPAVLARWSAAVDPTRVHVVTVPRPGADGLLWRRFTGVVGIDAGRLKVGADPSAQPDPLAVTEVIRRVNLARGEPVSPAPLGRMLADLHRGDGVRPSLPDTQRAAVVRASDETADALARGGYDVVGDLEDLRPSAEAFSSDAARTAPAPEDVLRTQTRLIMDLARLDQETARGPAGLRRRTLAVLGRRRGQRRPRVTS